MNSLPTLPEDILSEVVRAAPEKDWFNFHRASKSFRKVVDSVVADAVKMLTTRKAFVDACRDGNYLTIRSFAKGSAATTHKWRLRSWQNDGLQVAASQRHALLTSLLRSLRNIDIAAGIIGAIQSGDLEWIESCIPDGYDGYIASNASIIKAAIDSGNVDIVKMFTFAYCDPWLLNRALKNGSSDMVKLFWRGRYHDAANGADLIFNAYMGGKRDLIEMESSINDVCDLYIYALGGSCAGGHIKKVQELAPYSDAHSRGYALMKALSHGKRDCAIYLLGLGAPITNDCLDRACSIDDVMILDLVIDKLAYPKGTWVTSLQAAADLGNINIVKRLTTFRQYHNADLNDALERAAATGSQELVDYLISQGADNYIGAFTAAICGRAYDIAERMLQLDATVLRMPVDPTIEDVEFVYDHLKSQSGQKTGPA